jgi:hypothetical protein
VLTINVAFLLTVIVLLRLRRRTQARSRNDEQFTVITVLALGVLLAPTKFGQGRLHVLDQLAHSVGQIHI